MHRESSEPPLIDVAWVQGHGLESLAPKRGQGGGAATRVGHELRSSCFWLFAPGGAGEATTLLQFLDRRNGS